MRPQLDGNRCKAALATVVRAAARLEKAQAKGVPNVEDVQRAFQDIIDNERTRPRPKA